MSIRPGTQAMRPPHPLTILQKLIAAEAEIERLKERVASLQASCGECHLQPGEVCDICGRRCKGSRHDHI